MIYAKRFRRTQAFTLAEAAVSVVIVGVMLVTALNTVGAARLGEYKIAERSRGLLLAQDLMAEILQREYEDPDGTVVFGAESGEQTSTRTDFDDVDDYHNWLKSPPQQKDGTTIPDLAGWERSVEVVWIAPGNLSQTVGSDQGVKRATVTVKHNGVPVASVSAFRTSAWELSSN
jgi:hypothetical protein